MTINSYGKPFLAPGIYENLPLSEYQRDPCERPSFNFSVGKILLEKPPLYAWLAHPKLNPDWQPPPWDKRLDEGELIHSGLLGPGRDYEVADYPDYRTKEAREWRDSIVASGKIPVLKKANTKISQCIEAVELRLPFSTKCSMEQTYIFEHEGVLCRARIDALDDECVYDIKTVESLSDGFLVNQIENFKYDMQAAFYLLAAGVPRFKWVFVEINPPFQIRVWGAQMWLDIGCRKVRYALDKWQECMGINVWPGYSAIVEYPPRPPWSEDKWLKREIAENGRETDSGDC